MPQREAPKATDQCVVLGEGSLALRRHTPGASVAEQGEGAGLGTRSGAAEPDSARDTPWSCSPDSPWGLTRGSRSVQTSRVPKKLVFTVICA